MLHKTVCLNNPSGLHARPASKLCAIARRFVCRIRLEHDNRSIDAKLILDVMAANLKKGATIELYCEGADEKIAMDALVEFIDALSD